MNAKKVAYNAAKFGLPIGFGLQSVEFLSKAGERELDCETRSRHAKYAVGLLIKDLIQSVLYGHFIGIDALTSLEYDTLQMPGAGYVTAAKNISKFNKGI